MASLLNLGQALGEVFKATKSKALDFEKELFYSILVELVKATPVDTTKAVSNWRINIDVADNQVIGPYAPGKKGETAPQSREETLAHARAALQSVKLGQVLSISNPVPYMDKLDKEGISKQAPPGFINTAIQKAVIATLNKYGKV